MASPERRSNGQEEVATKEVEPGLFVYQVTPEPSAAIRRTVNGRIAHAKQTAIAIRRAVAARKRSA